jgi:hypothetical protein
MSKKSPDEFIRRNKSLGALYHRKGVLLSAMTRRYIFVSDRAQQINAGVGEVFVSIPFSP